MREKKQARRIQQQMVPKEPRTPFDGKNKCKSIPASIAETVNNPISDNGKA